MQLFDISSNSKHNRIKVFGYSGHVYVSNESHLFNPTRVGDVERDLHAAAVRRDDQHQQEHPEGVYSGCKQFSVSLLSSLLSHIITLLTEV